MIQYIEPEPPNAPENVTEGDIEVNGQEISATVHWLPAKSDLPITRYKVTLALLLNSVYSHEKVVLYAKCFSDGRYFGANV